MGGVTVHLACRLTAKNMSVSEGKGNAVCFARCVCLFVAFKALSPRRQTARTKSTDKQHIFPCHAKQFRRRRIVDATQTEKHFRDAFKYVWLQKLLEQQGECVSNFTITIYIVLFHFFFFFYETVDLTEPFLENVKPPGVRSPCISTFPIRTALKGKWKLSTSPVLIYNTNHFFGKYGNVHNNTAQ